MTLISFKLLAATSIFLLTLCAGLIPLRCAIRNTRLFHLGDAFASGIFLSAALLHLLPDSESIFHKIYANNSYPLAQLFCIIAFLFLLIMEHGIALYSKNRAANNCGQNHEHAVCCCGKNFLTPLLLLIVLSIHSFVEGAAIGISSGLAGALVIYIAVIVHKGSESLALASNLYRYSLKLHHITRLIIAFSFMTPLGILLASLVNNVIDHSVGPLLEAIFNAVAAGTFLYLGTIHIMECEKSFEDLGEIIALILGIVLMSTVAIWV